MLLVLQIKYCYGVMLIHRRLVKRCVSLRVEVQSDVSLSPSPRNRVSLKSIDLSVSRRRGGRYFFAQRCERLPWCIEVLFPRNQPTEGFCPMRFIYECEAEDDNGES